MKQRAYFPVARGLIDPLHHKQVGSSIWVYLWVINSQTDNEGAVAYRRPVTRTEIGQSLEMDEVTISRHLARLQERGYLNVSVASGKGLKIVVLKPLQVRKEVIHRTDATLGNSARGQVDTPCSSARGPLAELPTPSLDELKREEKDSALWARQTREAVRLLTQAEPLNLRQRSEIVYCVESVLSGLRYRAAKPEVMARALVRAVRTLDARVALPSLPAMTALLDELIPEEEVR